jgi:hypothetical protein
VRGASRGVHGSPTSFSSSQQSSLGSIPTQCT